MPVILGPRCNRRVTCDASPSNARSESATAINPNDPYNIIGSSKRFTDPAIYAFSLAAYASFDGGLSWAEAPPLTLGDPMTPSPVWAGTSDPDVAWDDQGNAYLIALPFAQGTATDFTGPLIGIAVYKSTDGGRTWGIPKLIHQSTGDDKQWITGDANAGSPFKGHVYAAWDNGSQLAFGRTIDHGASWIGMKVAGVNQSAGTSLPGVTDSFSPEISVAADGTVYIVWLGSVLDPQKNQLVPAIKFVKSPDGGDSFSAPDVVATGITPIPYQLPGGTFRTPGSLPTGCTGTGNIVVVAWADYRDNVSRIYYRRSTTAGNSWQGPASGQPLLTGGVASPADEHEFQPQIVSTPDGEIGCAFYLFGPKGGGGAAPKLVDVILAVSTNSGNTFPNRVTVTEQAWDPTVDPVYAHGNPNITFIGDYFGLDASRLGFFPLWTDTRTGVQEIFTARVSVNPADVYIRDYTGDMGNITSQSNPNSWEAPDLVVRRQQDGFANFSNQDLLRDGVTNHYIYGRVWNKGPNAARNVTLAVTVGNYPSLQGLPGSEFRYPQDWYPGDWNTPALQTNHLYLGETPPIASVASGTSQIVGPILWQAAQIPQQGTWHPCLLAEARADNNDSAGGTNGCDIDADADPCVYGAYFWGNNNVCQRNLSYAPLVVHALKFVELPFIVGSPWSRAQFVEVIVDKGRELAFTPMRLRLEEVYLREPPLEMAESEIVFIDGGRVIVRVRGCDIGEIVASPGTVWRPRRGAEPAELCYGGEKLSSREWKLLHPRSAVGFPVFPGEMRRMVLAFEAPRTLPAKNSLVRIFQRNDKRLITGSVQLELTMEKEANIPREGAARRRRMAAATSGRRRRR